MEKKSGIAAIILSGVIAFGIAGDIRPSTAASVSVSQPSEDTSSQNASSADSLNELCGMIMNAQSPAQWTDSIALYNYYFENFSLYNVAQNETCLLYTSHTSRCSEGLHTLPQIVRVDC